MRWKLALRICPTQNGEIGDRNDWGAMGDLRPRCWWQLSVLHGGTGCGFNFLASDQSGAGIPEVFTAEANETTEAGVAREEAVIEGLGGQYRPGQMAEDRRTGVGWGQWAYPDEAVWAEDPQLSPVTRMYFNGYFGRVLELETDAPEDWLLQGHAAAAEGDLERAMDLYFQASGGQASLEQRATMHLRLTRLLSGESNFWGEVDGPFKTVRRIS